MAEDHRPQARTDARRAASTSSGRRGRPRAHQALVGAAALPDARMRDRPQARRKFPTRMTGPDGFDYSGTRAASSRWSRAKKSCGPARSAPATARTNSPTKAAAAFRSPRSTPSRMPATARPAISRRCSTRKAEEREAHDAMGFHEGWGTCADQLAKSPRPRRERLKQNAPDLGGPAHPFHCPRGLVAAIAVLRIVVAVVRIRRVIAIAVIRSARDRGRHR